MDFKMAFPGHVIAGFQFNKSHLNMNNWTSILPENYNPSLLNHTLSQAPDYECELLGLHSDLVNEVKPTVTVTFYITLFLIVSGLIGNTLSIMVFSSRDMRIVSSNVYLLLLAISDSLYLLAVFSTNSLKTMQCLFEFSRHADINNHSDVMCRLLQFTLDLFSNYSSCLILAFTVERYIAIYLPVQFKWLCNVRRARMVCSFILLVVAISIAPYHYVMIGLEKNSCVVLQGYENLFTTYYTIEMIVFRILPVLFIGGLNTAIICRVMKLRRKRLQRRNFSMSMTTSVATGLTNADRSTPGIHKHLKRRNTQTDKMVQHLQKKSDRSMQLTIILLLVSASYIICYLPVLGVFVVSKFSMNTPKMPLWKLVVLQCCSRTLYVAGFAVNFLLYTVSGRVFREQLEAMVCGGMLWRSKGQGRCRGGGGRDTAGGFVGPATTSGHRLTSGTNHQAYVHHQHQHDQRQQDDDDLDCVDHHLDIQGSQDSHEKQVLVGTEVTSTPHVARVTGELNISMI